MTGIDEAVVSAMLGARTGFEAHPLRHSNPFPHYTRQQRKGVVRCVAEQAEVVIARPAWRRNPAGSAGAHRRLSPDEVEGCAQFDVDESHGLLPMRSLSRSVGSPVRAGELIAAAASGFVLRRWWVPVVAVPAVVRAPGAAGRSGVGVDRHGRGHATDAELGPTILAATGVRSVAPSNQGAAPSGRAFTHRRT